jgi:hypothetical protein
MIFFFKKKIQPLNNVFLGFSGKGLLTINIWGILEKS